MIIIIRLIISTYLNSGSKRPSRSRGTIASTVSFLLLRLPTLACLLFGPLPLVTYLYIAFPRSLDSLFLKRFLQIWSREHTHLPFITIRTSPQPPPPTLPSIPYQYYYSYSQLTMDVANLISQPGPDPTIKARPVYSTPVFKASSDDKSYFTPVYSRSQPPLSPPVEDYQPKCSLPSISTLFEGADSAAMQPASMLTSSPSPSKSHVWECPR